MNCRLNEEKVFPSPKVAQVLQDHYIEARLHTDGEQGERLIRLQQELGHSVATPLYLIQDPEDRRKLGGPLSGVTTVGTFQTFLLDAVESKERVGRLDGR